MTPSEAAARAAILACAGACAAGALAICAAGCEAAKVERCANVTLRHGEQTCVGPIDAAMQARRGVSFRLRSEHGRTVRVERVSGPGELTADATGAAVWQPLRGERGEVKGIALRDRLDHPLPWTWSVEGGGARMFQRDRLGAPRNDSQGSRNQLDAAGYVTEARFVDRYDQPRLDAGAGAYGLRSTLDARGLATAQVSLGADGKPAPSSEGWTRSLRTFSPLGDLTSDSLLDERDRPATHKDGWSAWRATLDAAGNALAVRYLDARGQPVRLGDGTSGWTATFDAHGNETSRSFFGPDDAPALRDDHVGGWTARFDDRGRVTLQTFTGVESNVNGVSRIETRYDGRGLAVEERYLGKDGKPAPNRYGIAIVRRQFDALGDVTEESYFDAAGHATRAASGFATRRARFDELGDELEESYLDEAGRPVARKEGHGGLRMRYDEHQRLVELTYLDARGAPRASAEGFAAYRSSYDAAGEEVSREFRGEGGKPVIVAKLGAAGWRRSFDPRGRQVEFTHLGEGGQPIVVQADGYAGWRKELDAAGRPLRWEYLGGGGKPMMIDAGYAAVTSTFDAGGHLTSRSFFDADGRKVVARIGCAVERSTANSAGLPIDYQCLDADDAPLVHLRWASVFGDGYRGTSVEAAPPEKLAPPLRRVVALFRASLALVETRRAHPELFGGARGVLVGGVAPGGTGERLHLAIGDLLLRYDGKPLDRAADLGAAVAAARGPSATLVLLRDGRRQTLAAPPGPLGIDLE